MRSECWIARSAFDELIGEARRSPLRETGGALLGWRGDGGVVVARVLGPGPLARHNRRSFMPDGDWQQSEGERIYRDSGRTIAYLGDWHTHPWGTPSPSAQDMETVQMIATDSAFRVPSPLYAIAGRGWSWKRRPAWRLCVWEWRDEHLAELALRPFDLTD